MRRQQDHEAPLGGLDKRQVGEREVAIERLRAVERKAENEEVNGQEEYKRYSRETMREERQVPRTSARRRAAEPVNDFETVTVAIY